MDAVVERIELAQRDFVERATSSGDFLGYVRTCSERLKVRVDEVDASVISQRSSSFYLLSVYQQADLFLGGFLKEWKSPGEISV